MNSLLFFKKMFVSGRDVARDIPMWGKTLTADNIEITPFPLTTGKIRHVTFVSNPNKTVLTPYDTEALYGGAIPIAAVAQAAAPIVLNAVKTGLSNDADTRLAKPELKKTKESCADVLWYLRKKDGGKNGAYQRVMKALQS